MTRRVKERAKVKARTERKAMKNQIGGPKHLLPPTSSKPSISKETRNPFLGANITRKQYVRHKPQDCNNKTGTDVERVQLQRAQVALHAQEGSDSE